MKLLIISHTEHYKNSNGEILGWGPTVNEINHLASNFTSITHLAMLHPNQPPASSIAYKTDNIYFKSLPALGGRTILSKLKLLWYMPKVIKIVKNALKDVDAFQLRVPTGIGVFLIPYLTWFSKKEGWYKYAGNWNQKKPPLGYKLQRLMLKKQKRRVTINGEWSNQLKHCITFENPCLMADDIENGLQTRKDKTLDNKLNFCYVGRLETPKGVGRIIEAFNTLSEEHKNKVNTVHLVGDGNEKEIFRTLASKSNINYKFHGFLSRKSVFEIYKKSHFFLMPTTASEGFPKVIAEAINFGCVPVISNVSAIGHYIKDGVIGIFIEPISSSELKKKLEIIFDMNQSDYEQLMSNGKEIVNKFSYENYNQRIFNEILNH